MVATPSRARVVRPPSDLNFKGRLVLREERAVVRHAEARALGLGLERVGDAAVAEAEVVAVTLAVGRDVDYLSAGPRGGAHARADERVARREKALEGDGARYLAVVEEDRERTARAVAVEVSVEDCRVNVARGDRAPLVFISVERSDALGL